MKRNAQLARQGGWDGDRPLMQEPSGTSARVETHQNLALGVAPPACPHRDDGGTRWSELLTIFWDGLLNATW